jgi:hypothetical protein
VAKCEDLEKKREFVLNKMSFFSQTKGCFFAVHVLSFVVLLTSLSLLDGGLGGLSLHQLLVPCSITRQRLFNVGLESGMLVTEDEGQHHVPGDKSQIGIGVLVTDQVVGAFGLEVLVENAEDTLDFVSVALDGRGQLFGVVSGEPDALAKVGTLA